MHARSFLYTLYGFDMTLKVLANTDNVPEAVQDASAKFGEAFACIRGVENSVHNPEGGERGLDAGKNVKSSKVRARTE